jgi:hypothetical protein
LRPIPFPLHPSFESTFSSHFPQVYHKFFHTKLVAGTPVPLPLLPPDRETTDGMARFSAFLGRRVEVQYRAGDILLPASGTLVADSGRSIFLEQMFEQRGQHRHFRWEIPYQCLIRIEEKRDSGASSSEAPIAAKTAATPEASDPVKPEEEPRSAAAAASAGGAPGLLPMSRRPKTA